MRNIRRCRALESFSFDEGVLNCIEFADLQLNADHVVLSACNTVADEMLTAVLRQLAAASLNDTPSARNAYPAFWALLAAGARRSLALFVHRNALCASGKATKRRLTAVKTTGKRKRSERVSRCGICIR
ncbi:hypothetical protein ABIB82_004443 [Bradyrhizobium sp. i1.8.4]|uniref:hypothetical protein n=1 Tax=unclassified Bradyrhizobium TaxID=2631580 RepID=UPI003D1B778B